MINRLEVNNLQRAKIIKIEARQKMVLYFYSIRIVESERKKESIYNACLGRIFNFNPQADPVDTKHEDNTEFIRWCLPTG